MSEWIKKLTEKYSEVNEKAKPKMDPVGKADADIDNDGDVDKSDSYLHNRRKAISNAKKKDSKEDVVMNPTKKGNTTTAESKAWPIYSRIMEKKSEQTKNAAPADKLDDDDTLPGKGAKDMAKDIAVDKSKADMEKQGHDSVSAANRAGPTASGDEHLKSANKGDKNVVNPAKGAVTKEEVEQVDEISKKTLGSYIKKASDDKADNAFTLGRKDPSGKPGSWSKSFKRRQGIAKAVDKLTK